MGDHWRTQIFVSKNVIFILAIIGSHCNIWAREWLALGCRRVVQSQASPRISLLNSGSLSIPLTSGHIITGRASEGWSPFSGTQSAETGAHISPTNAPTWLTLFFFPEANFLLFSGLQYVSHHQKATWKLLNMGSKSSGTIGFTPLGCYQLPWITKAEKWGLRRRIMVSVYRKGGHGLWSWAQVLWRRELWFHSGQAQERGREVNICIFPVVIW